MKISIEAARVNAKLTLVEAAKKLGVNSCTLSNYENGKTHPRFDTLEKMSEVYGIPIEYLRAEEG